MVSISLGSACNAVRAAADSGTRAASISAATPEARHSLARSPASPSDTSIAAVAYVRTASASALRGSRHQIARQQMAALRRVDSFQRFARACVLRSFNPSAASPIVPVTMMWSPARAPARRTMVPRRHVPNAVIEIISGPGVVTVSPPSSGQP